MKFKLELSETQKTEFLSQIYNESQFFYQNGINDYSLLIGVHEVRKRNFFLIQDDIINYYSRSRSFSVNVDLRYEDIVEEVIKDHPIYSNIHNGIFSKDYRYIYFIGIIDTLTEYNTKKKFEYTFKKTFFGKGISCLPPKDYAARFNTFISTNIV